MKYRQNLPIQQPSFKVHVTRGNSNESVHFVDAIVMDKNGQIVFSAGEVFAPEVFPRSCIKMMQAVSLVESGAVEKWGLDSRHVTLACASHNGEEIHTNLAAEWLKKINCDMHHLVCAAHNPYSEKAFQHILRTGGQINQLHNNCSGKHTGILCALRTLGMDVLGYEKFDHPYQYRLRKIVSELCEENIHQAPWGVDGCGIPTYAMSLKAIAKGLTQFLPGARVSVPEYEKHCQLIMKSVLAHPQYIGGANDFCTAMIEISQQKVFAKSGAEGVYAGLFLEQGFAFAIKVKDGAPRAAKAVVFELLNKFEALDENQLLQLSHHTSLVKNWAGKTVGKIFVAKDN